MKFKSQYPTLDDVFNKHYIYTPEILGRISYQTKFFKFLKCISSSGAFDRYFHFRNDQRSDKIQCKFIHNIINPVPITNKNE